MAHRSLLLILLAPCGTALLAPPGGPLVTHSSGNHAQALALAAKATGREAHIVMPSNAPAVKVAAVRGYVVTHCCLAVWHSLYDYCVALTV